MVGCYERSFVSGGVLGFGVGMKFCCKACTCYFKVYKEILKLYNLRWETNFFGFSI